MVHTSVFRCRFFRLGFFFCVSIFFSLLCMVFIFGCSFSASSLYGLDSIQVTTYNLQTFFDAQTVGTEYDDFKGSKTSWSASLYKERIDRLCSVLQEIDSDIYVFQEIENADIIYDISNNLKSQSDSSRTFTNAVFVPSRDKALGCAVLSRFPILSCTSHQIDYSFYGSLQPDTRPLMEVNIHCGFSIPLTVFVGHWKSKSGGEEASEVWRNRQEDLLLSRIQQSNSELFIFCGDCNRDIEEFSCVQQKVELSGRKGIQSVSSPWLFEEYAVIKGSYFYQKAWGKIDHFFLGSQVDLRSFKSEDYKPLVTEEAIPFRYTVWTGQGYSDHLPLTCIISEKE